MKIALFFITSISTLVQEEELVNIGPIKEPSPVEFTFETFGWYILAVILLILFGVALYKRYKVYQKNKYRRDALKKLHHIQHLPGENYSQINSINVLLKQVAITTFGRERVAVIYGDEWYSFLESTSKNTNFTNYSAVFSKAVYDNEDAESKDFNKIIQLTKIWIKNHA